MLNRLTYRQQFFLAMAGLLVFGWAVYSSAIARTMETAAECHALEAKLAQGLKNGASVTELQQELETYERLIGAGDAAPDEIQQAVLQHIDAASEEWALNVSQVDPIHRYRALDYECNTFVVTVKGGYHDLVKLSASLEQEFEWAGLKSVSYDLEVHPRTRKKSLYATFFLQHVHKV